MPPSAISSSPGLSHGRAGERALLVAEQLALEQRLGERSAVDAQQRLTGALRRGVDHLGEHFLAGSGLAEQQDRQIACRDARCELMHVAHTLVGNEWCGVSLAARSAGRRTRRRRQRLRIAAIARISDNTAAHPRAICSKSGADAFEDVLGLGEADFDEHDSVLARPPLADDVD